MKNLPISTNILQQIGVLETVPFISEEVNLGPLRVAGSGKFPGKDPVPFAKNITKIEVLSDQGKIRVFIEGDGELKQKSFMIDDHRLVVDLPGTSSQLESRIFPGVEPLLKRIRIGQHDIPKKVRVVLDLNESVPFKVIEKGKIISVLLTPESLPQPLQEPLAGNLVVVDGTGKKVNLPEQKPLEETKPILVASKNSEVEILQAPNGSGENSGIEPEKTVPVSGKPSSHPNPKLITMDFNNVDLPVLVKFISELTNKNFMIDEKVRGRVTIFSPRKMNPDEAYDVFLSVLDLKGLAAVPMGEIVQIVPKNQVPEEQDINVYFLENSNAEDMAKLLAGLVARAGTAGRARSVGQSGVRTSVGLEGQVQIFPDKATNSLIITSSPNDFETIKGVIQKLDVRRRQVYVEAVILEIGLDTLREIGVEAQVPIKTQDGELADVLSVAGGTNFGGISSLATQGPIGLTGLAVGIIKGTFTFQGREFLNIGGLLRALQSDADVNILSTPQLLTSDNQKAEIVVGQNIPVSTGQSQTTGGNTITTIQRMDVGITLRLVPQILENNLVKMDVFQEISTVTDTPQSIEDIFVGPTTNKRSTNTTVMVEDQQTAVLGGLIKDDMIKSERKVPFLGDIPLLGWLFKFESRRIEKRNLLIFLTPYIVRDAEEMDQITLRKSQEMVEYLELNKVELRKRRIDFLEKGINPPVTPGLIH